MWNVNKKGQKHKLMQGGKDRNSMLHCHRYDLQRTYPWWHEQINLLHSAHVDSVQVLQSRETRRPTTFVSPNEEKTGHSSSVARYIPVELG